MDIAPASLSQVERYKLLIGCIVPRPIAWVSTTSIGGHNNLAPFSFFAGVGSNPMTLLFCPASKDDGSEKDSLRNAKLSSDTRFGTGGTGEFVVNIVPEGLARQMAACAEPLAFEESEFELSGVTPIASKVVRPPRVGESPVSFECRTIDVIRTNPGQPSSGNIVLGEVVWIHIRDELINERRHVDPALLAAIGRMGGSEYVRTADPAQRFEVPMGRQALG